MYLTAPVKQSYLTTYKNITCFFLTSHLVLDLTQAHDCQYKHKHMTYPATKNGLAVFICFLNYCIAYP